MSQVFLHLVSTLFFLKLLPSEGSDPSKWLLFITSVSDPKPLCDAILLSYSHGLTSCECACVTEFMYPELLVKEELTYLLAWGTRQDINNFQWRKIAKFHLHPKCTTHSKVIGLFVYNFAVAETTGPFKKTSFIKPISLPEIDFEAANEIFWNIVKNPSASKCHTQLWMYDDKSRQIHLLKTNATCVTKSRVPKVESADFEADGLVCFEPEVNDYTYVFKRMYSSQTNLSCDFSILSGSPVYCGEALIGLVGPGVCRPDVPVILSRIEPAYGFLERGIWRASSNIIT